MKSLQVTFQISQKLLAANHSTSKAGYVTSVLAIVRAKLRAREATFFSHRSSGPPVHFTHQTLTISSFGYLL